MVHGETNANKNFIGQRVGYRNRMICRFTCTMAGPLTLRIDSQTRQPSPVNKKKVVK